LYRLSEASALVFKFSQTDRADLFRRAAGSASELTTALRIARARGYITPAEFAAVDVVLDRVRAMLWRLTH
jgi:four helix bundle protein